MKGGAASELEGQGEGGDLGGKSLILNLVISRYLGGQGQGLVALGKFVKMSFFVLRSWFPFIHGQGWSLLSFLIWSTRIYPDAPNPLPSPFDEPRKNSPRTRSRPVVCAKGVIAHRTSQHDH